MKKYESISVKIIIIIVALIILITLVSLVVWIFYVNQTMTTSKQNNGELEKIEEKLSKKEKENNSLTPKPVRGIVNKIESDKITFFGSEDGAIKTAIITEDTLISTFILKTDEEIENDSINATEKIGEINSIMVEVSKEYKQCLATVEKGSEVETGCENLENKIESLKLERNKAKKGLSKLKEFKSSITKLTGEITITVIPSSDSKEDSFEAKSIHLSER